MLTKEQKEYIKNNVKKMYLNNISSHLGVDYNQVYYFCKANNLKIKNRAKYGTTYFLNNHKDEIIEKLKRIGKKEICDELGMNVGTFEKWMYKNDIHSNTFHRITEEDIKYIEKNCYDTSVRAIAKKIKCSTQLINKTIDKLASKGRIQKENIVNKRKGDTLCWECARACGHCDWSKHFKPISGWKAEKTVIEHSNCESFFVQKCPLFVRGRNMEVKNEK